MYSRLPDYEDFRGFDLSGGNDLTAISNRIYEGFAKHPWLTLKHHLFIAQCLRNYLKPLSKFLE